MKTARPSPPPRQRYRRLTRTKAGVGHYTHLWQGPDHLLLVTATGWSENYWRFYFRDIQGLYLQPDRRRMHWSVVWGGFGTLFTLFVLLVGESLPAALCAGVLFLIPFIWNLLLGPGCRVYVITAVQTTRLEPLARERKARRVLAELRPVIQAAQKDLVRVPPLPTAGDAPEVAPPAAPGPAPHPTPPPA